MVGNSKEIVIDHSASIFPRVIGGELPLSNEAAAMWLEDSQGDIAAVKALCEVYGGNSESARWLRYGRSALGLALDLCGVGPSDIVTISPYQCSAVINKVASRSRNWQTYALDEYLVPDPDGLLAQGRAVKVVFTCVYFGSAAIEEKLGEMENSLMGLPQRPWIIEDRVMCFPDPGQVPLWEKRCDFALVSFRKHYPVPDGALLIACSDRARERLFEWSKKVPDAGAEWNLAIRQKVLAKVKRYAWLSSSPLIDDPAQNGLNESIASEALVDAVAASPIADSLPGTAASARYILGRDLTRDASGVRARSRVIVDGLLAAGLSPTALKLRDCGGVGVPLLMDRRDIFRAMAAEMGIFLPTHWPRLDVVPLYPSVGRWYEEEITVPIMPEASADDTKFLIDTLIQICCALRFGDAF